MSEGSYAHVAVAPGSGAPLIFAFHGTGGDAEQMVGFARSLVPGAGVVAPRGDVFEGGAARFFRRSGEGVYDMDDLARATVRMAGFVADHAAMHPGAPVWGVGYSNGANILASVAMARPDLFGRVVLLHPLIPWDPEPVPGLVGRHVLVTAGRRDPICPWPLSERLIGWFGAQGAQIASEVHEGGHEIRPVEIEALVKFFDAGA
ncbi:alpha/beta hydrolase [Palleronia sp. LCG004]|uniref:alpha/beta hydrolase n=1 Tax=Palleronia sp. LCG004 TaxID=3079304 RepID=UPI002942C88E|nr:alpha/beta hydrolase [Palleronia sp. LCG004]WOI57666.1 alpha/beta hydrolase [Palleronia sp. LCG004]